MCTQSIERWRLQFNTLEINLSTALAGQAVGVKDLEEKTLQPLNNPEFVPDLVLRCATLAVNGVPMNPVSHLIPGIRSFRPFLPAKEFKTSLRFYESIGFEAYRLGDTLAELSLGAHAFLLQGHYVKEWAENTVMHVLVNDVHAWWQHINSLDLANQFGVSSPAPPHAEPWGLTVVYVFDPTGVLWHFAEVTK